MRFSVFFVALLVAFTAVKIQETVQFIIGVEVDPINDSQCEVVGAEEGLLAAEDMGLWRDGIVFIGSGDLHAVFDGLERAGLGGFFMLDLSKDASKLKRVPVDGLVAGYDVQIHGIFVSNVTDRLLAVNHQNVVDEVLVFDILKTETEIRLVFVRSVRSPEFLSPVLNDVVEGQGRNELFVSQWLYKSMTHNNPIIFKLLNVAAHQIGLPINHVYRCTWDNTTTNCAIAATNFVSANGMATNPERSRIFVSDPGRAELSILSRDKNTLTRLTTHQLEMIVDNVDFHFHQQDSKLVAGTIPSLLNVFRSIILGKKLAIAGGVAEISLETGKMTHHVVHDGTKLSQISSGLVFGSWALLGSPTAFGLLRCRVG